MNTLSWLIYFGDVLDGLGKLLMFVVAVLFLGSTAFVGGTCLWAMDRFDGLAERRWTASRKLWLRLLKWNLPLLVVFALFTILVPSKTTFYMIAASEVGETTVKTPEAQVILDKLRAKIERYLDEGK